MIGVAAPIAFQVVITRTAIKAVIARAAKKIVVAIPPD